MNESTPGAPGAPAKRKKGVPVWLVVVGALAACLAILVLVGVIVAYYAISHSDGLKRGAQEARERGAAYGRSHEQRECVQDALSRLDTADFMQQVQDRLVLDACLEVARPTEGFCQDVPPEAKILSSVLWRQEACSGYGKPDNQDCARLLGKVQSFCHPREERSGGDSSEPSR